MTQDGDYCISTTKQTPRELGEMHEIEAGNTIVFNNAPSGPIQIGPIIHKLNLQQQRSRDAHTLSYVNGIVQRHQRVQQETQYQVLHDGWMNVRLNFADKCSLAAFTIECTCVAAINYIR